MRVVPVLALGVIAAVVFIQWQLVRNRRVSDPPAVNPVVLPTARAPRGPLSGRNLGVVVGHWSRNDAFYDPGAVCSDAAGQPYLTELEVNQDIAARLVPQLEERGAQVWVLEELDPRMAGLYADLVLSLHADSCAPVEATGFKAAYLPTSGARERESRFVTCLQEHYAARTGLAWHAHSITRDMTHYHMHEKVHLHTPSIILEMGFMGGDQRLLTTEQAAVVDGIRESILCFFAPAP